MSTWVLLRGLTRESGHWGAFPEMLSERMPGARVLTLDLPGNGRLNHAPSPTSIEATMQNARQQMKASGHSPPFHLLAMSLGAMVAVEWACSHPEELAGCVLVNTSLRPFSRWYQRLRPANYAALLGVVAGAMSSRQREQTILRLTSRHLAPDDGVIDDWTALREARPVSAANALRQLLAAARYRAPANAPAVPLLVLASRCDALVNAQCSRQLARQWRTAILEHPTAGHDLPLDDGPWVVEQILRWAGGGARSPLTSARPPGAAPFP
ncbi:alpha/beta hydrolase [Variovorax sp. J2P1-59]|uniref:alpha/beta fold hydrolase n=1 Tax=Variovorax flavidus TaxID=3053501 RepID=UPI0025763F0A|nr:alpha/beta hydrolase [Variovorax sp. J2P1-59]MDM0078272.1 alpha/beta hydrolase [Variovorax sp. J2P1-59]